MTNYSKIALVLAVVVVSVLCFSLTCCADAAADFKQYTTDAREGKFTQAIAGLQKLLAQGSTDVSSKETRAWLAIAHIGNGETALGKSEIAELLNEYPEYASELHFTLAKHYRRQSQFDDAISELKTALDLNKEPKENATHKGIRRYLMVCYASKGDLPNALAQLHIIMNDYPDEVSTFIVGESQRWQSKLPNAIEELRRAADALPPSDPNSSVLKRELAKCNIGGGCAAAGAYLDSGQYVECTKICKEIISVDPNPDSTSDAMVKLAESMYPLGKGKEALAFQEDFYKEHPDRKMEHEWVCCRTAYYAERDWAKAATLFEKFIADYPNSLGLPEVRSLLADALQSSKQTEKAIAAVDVLLKSAKGEDKDRLMMRKADIYFAGKKYREAADAYKDMLELKSTESYYRAKATYQLAMCYQKSGLMNSAKAYMRRVSEKYPDTSFAKKARGMIYVWDNYTPPNK